MVYWIQSKHTARRILYAGIYLLFPHQNHLRSSLEADPFNGKISKESPLGRAVKEAQEGDLVTVKTESGAEFKVKVVKIK